jgi:hypothetical protein
MEKAAQTAAERHFQYGQSNMNNRQKHRLKICYGENEECKEWLRLILAVPLLPHWFIPRAFKYLLFKIMLIVKVLDGIKDMSIING